MPDSPPSEDYDAEPSDDDCWGRDAPVCQPCEEERQEGAAPPDPGRGKRGKARQMYTTAEGRRLWNGRMFLCKHERNPSQCAECGGGGICEHGRQRSYCKECGGGSFCEHGRLRSRCKECGGGSLCEHGRVRSKCKDCGGGSLCEHGRARYTCKECGGGGICEHGRMRSKCKECGGGSLCEHGRRRSRCKECGGGSLCEHGRMRSECAECGGSAICEHGRMRSQCKECGGSAICEHGRQRSHCKECGGSAICEHGRRRSHCKECGGSAICEHGRRRSECVECGGSQICRGCEPGKLCPLGNRKSAFYDGRCQPCFMRVTEESDPTDPRLDKARKRLRVREDLTVKFLQEAFPMHRWTLNRGFAEGVLQRPDARMTPGKTRLIIVEVDEYSHATRKCAYEREREALFRQHAPNGSVIFLIRFNPDAYDITDPTTKAVLERIPTCFKRSKDDAHDVVDPNQRDQWERRLEALRATVQEILDHQHEDVAFLPEWLKDEDDRYANVHPIELFYDNVREKHGVDGDKGMLEGFKRATKKRKTLGNSSAADAAAPPPEGDSSE